MRFIAHLAGTALLAWLFACNTREPLPEFWQRALQQKDPEVRQEAVEQLGRRKDPRAVGPLSILAISDKEYRVRRAACEALGSIGDISAVNSIALVLRDDPEWPVRVAAAEVLGTLKSGTAVKPLGRALTKDPSDLVRCEAADALAIVGDQGAVEPLLTASNDPVRSVRRHALIALAELVRSRQIEGERVLQALALSLSKSDDTLVRKSAAHAFAAVDDERSRGVLLAALRQDQEDWIRVEIVNLVKDVRDDRVPGALVAALTDESDDVRAAAATALRPRVDSHAAGPLVALLGDSSPHVKDAAESTLLQLGPPAIPALSAVLSNDENSDRRQRAAAVLGKIGDAQAVAVLIRSMSMDAEAGVRAAAAEALGQIKDPRAETALIAALEGDRQEWVRLEATTALGNLHSIQAVPALIRLLDATSNELSREAARALGTIRDPRAAGPLTNALTGWRASSYSERKVFEEALKMLGPAAVPSLIAAMKDYDRRQGSPAQSVLEEIGRPAVEPLLAALAGSSEVGVREGAAHTLGRLYILGIVDDERVLRALETVSHDDAQQSIRDMAGDMLRSIEASRAAALARKNS